MQDLTRAPRARLAPLVAALLWSPAAWAGNDVAVAPPLRAAGAAGPSAPSARPNPLGATPLGKDALALKRGGSETFSDMTLRGVVANNKAVNTTTGANAISDGAFSGSAGLQTVIQNSGNNVLIQNATIVNVQMK